MSAYIGALTAVISQIIVVKLVDVGEFTGGPSVQPVQLHRGPVDEGADCHLNNIATLSTAY